MKKKFTLDEVNALEISAADNAILLERKRFVEILKNHYPTGKSVAGFLSLCSCGEAVDDDREHLASIVEEGKMNICLKHQQQYHIYCFYCGSPKTFASTSSTPLNARVDILTDSDGGSFIKVDVEETKEQIEQRVRDEEFEFYMRLLKANNGVGAMTEAMWLLFESDYYERGASKDIARWKNYLKKLDKENKNEC